MAHAVQITGTYGTGIGPQHTYVVKKLLEIAQPIMPLHQFTQKRFIPLNSGKTAQFTRLLHIAPVTSALTEGSLTDAVKVYAQDFTVSVKEWGKAVAVSTLLDDTFITPALEAQIELLGINMGESMQLELQKTLWGEDYDETTNTYEANTGAIGLAWASSATTLGALNYNVAATTSGSTTTFVSSTLIATGYGWNNDSFLGGGIVFTNPQSPNYGLGRRVFDYTSAAGTVTWKTATKTTTATLDNAAFVSGLETARVMSLSSATTLSLTANTDRLKAAALRRSCGILRKEMAQPIQPPYFAAVVSPDEYHNLAASTATGEFIDIHKYTDSGPLMTNEVGRIGGCKVILDNKPYKLAITSPFDYSATGGLHVTFVLGKNALGCVGLQGQNRLGQSDTDVIIKRPGPQTTSDPHNMINTASWKTTFARLSLDASNAVAIVSYPNAL